MQIIKYIIILTISFFAFSVGAEEIIPNFEEESISTLNEEMRQIRAGNLPSQTRDNDGLTMIQVEETADDNIIRFDIEVSNAGVEQLTIQDGKIEPTTDNDIDLGSSGKEYKNLYIDGTAYVDAIQLSTGVIVTEIENNDSLGTSDTKLCTQGNVKAYVDTEVASVIPSGVIVMWSGTLVNVPTGWSLCDGTGGTPDLRDRFIMGWSDGVDPATKAAGADTIGDHTHNFSGSALSNHSHDIFGNPSSNTEVNLSPKESDEIFVGAGTLVSNTSGGTPSGTNANYGTATFYQLAFIMKD